MIRKWIIALFILGVIVFCFLQFYHFLKKRIVTSDLKQVTEKRIGAFFKVPVHVDKISIGLLQHISLSGLNVNQTREGHPIQLGIKKIIVRYDLLSFLKRNFRIPTEIFLDAPRLTLQAFQSPMSLFEISLLRSKRGILTRFEFEEGEVHLPWFGSGETLDLIHTEGRATPKRGDLFDVRFKSHLSGVASGALLAYGEIDSSGKRYHLEVTLNDVAFSQPAQVPMTQLNGSIELENDTVRIHKIAFLLRGIPCELSGTVEKVFSEKPVFHLSVRIQEGKLRVQSDVRADFSQETVSGVVRLMDQEYQFSGSLVGNPADFRVPRLTINDLYQASGRFDVPAGNYQIEAQRGRQRLRLDFSWRNFQSQLVLKFDHFQIFGFDLVTYATLHVKPNEEAWQKGGHVFDVHIETDYLIFQHQPIRDFKASVRLSADGLDEISAHWGNVSRLQGRVLFGRVPQADLILGAGPLSLSEFESFGTHPLPLSLEGILEGKLAIRGPLEQPNLDGAFTIEGGTIGSFEYDRAVVNFTGELPYLSLKDSKIWKGKNSFLLKGGLDFRLQNFLEGIHADNSEQVIIWKGLELSSELEDPVRVLKNASPTSSFSRYHERQLRLNATPLAKVGAEYKLGERTSLHVTAEEDQAKKEYLTVGPKVKF